MILKKTDCGALYYSEIKAYIRCGDLTPSRFFELLEKDICDRVIVFGNGFIYNAKNPEEVFRTFEIVAPKQYILDGLANMREEQMAILSEINKKLDCVFPKI